MAIHDPGETNPTTPDGWFHYTHILCARKPTSPTTRIYSSRTQQFKAREVPVKASSLLVP